MDAPYASSLRPMARVRLFANLREMAGSSSVDVEGDTVGEVADALNARFGRDFERRLETARIWKNGREAVRADAVADGDELAVIPPVSGGAVAMVSGGGLESVFMAALVLVLLAANAYDGALFAALWVGVVALWAIDLASSASDGDFKLDYQPLLAAILVSMATAMTFGLTGLGVGAAISIVLAMGWTIFRPAARDLTVLAASALGGLIASLSVGSILLARLSESGSRKIAGLIIIAAVGALTGRLAESSRARIADPYTLSSVVTVLTAVAVAYLSSFPLLGWFFIGLVLAAAMIAGRGMGAAFRTGRMQLAIRPDGTLTALDGPMTAVAVFAPVLWLIA